MQKKYNFIIEQTFTNPINNIEILEESKVNNVNKVAFLATLQEADKRNNNKRFYTKSITESIVNNLSPRANSRSLLMEIDHPMFISSDPDVVKKRAAIVEIGNCGGLLRNIKMKDNLVIGEIESLSGFRGPDLYNIIMRDKVNLGFSLRALGSVESMADGTLMVKQPIMPITYDIVSNPSHNNAHIIEFIPESSLGFFNSESSVINEQLDVNFFDSEKINICDGNSCIYQFIDEIINDHFSEAIRGIKFLF